MKQSGRKWLGILLAASIVAATVFPMQGTAAEGIDRGAESEMQKDEGMETQGALPGTGIKAPAEGEGSEELPGNPNAAGGAVRHSLRQYIATRRFFDYACRLRY